MTPAILAALEEAALEAIDSVHDMDVTHQDYASAVAKRVLELVGPMELEWAKEANSPYHKSGRYTVYQAGSVLGAPTNWLVDFGNSTRRWEPTLEAAQSAAQAHADAAHWKNTKIGGV